MAKTNRFTAAAKRAKQQTDEEYQTVIAGITRLTTEDVEKLFPERVDQERLLELMALVNSSTSENQKLLKLKENAEKFGAVTLRLLALLT